MGDVVVLAFTAALNPTELAATAVMLLLPSPERLMFGYWLGAMFTGMASGLIIVFALKDTNAGHTTTHTLGPVVWLVVAALLLVAAFAFARGADRGVRERREAREAITRDRCGDGRGVQAIAIVRPDDDEGRGREAQLVEGAGDREMSLVADVHTDVFEGATTGRRGGTIGAPNERQMDIACQGHRQEVGHHAARGQDPERTVAVADDVAQPADDLLLDEGTDRPGVHQAARAQRRG